MTLSNHVAKHTESICECTRSNLKILSYLSLLITFHRKFSVIINAFCNTIKNCSIKLESLLLSAQFCVYFAIGAVDLFSRLRWIFQWSLRMASKLGDLLTCPICLDTLSKPKALPCQHSFCDEPCMKNFLQGRTVSCPVCRRVHEIPNEGFPTNFLIEQWVLFNSTVIAIR